ncbi:hypothetical protein [Roseivivax jejudonensis]|nr:hypothetical protein [Roseivivax jejudonensis]
MRNLVLSTALALAAAPAAAETLLCLGMQPGFMLTIEGDTVAFDYAGDGQFELDPPLPARGLSYSRHTLVTARQRWPLYLEGRDCAALGATFPVSVEIGVPVRSRVEPFSGCCTWRD